MVVENVVVDRNMKRVANEILDKCSHTILRITLGYFIGALLLLVGVTLIVVNSDNIEGWCQPIGWMLSVFGFYGLCESTRKFIKCDYRRAKRVKEKLIDEFYKKLYMRELTNIEILSLLINDCDIRQYVKDCDFFDLVLNKSDQSVLIVEEDGRCYVCSRVNKGEVQTVWHKVDLRGVNVGGIISSSSIYLHIPDEGKWYLLDHSVLHNKGVHVQ